MPDNQSFSPDAERQEGEINSLDVLTLDLTDEEAAKAVGNRIKGGTDFWNEELKLDDTRKNSERYWLNEQLDVNELYDFQVPYKDPRIHVAIESLLPMILAKPAQPLVTQAYDSDASYELAQNLQKTLLAKYEDLYLKKAATFVVRHILTGQRVAYLKYRWNADIGPLKDDGDRYGDIEVSVPRPGMVILDAGATDVDDVPLIAENMNASIEELSLKFPTKKDDILKKGDKQAGVAVSLSKTLGYYETWFTYYKDGKKEAVLWKLEELILGKMKNPNWNYDESRLNSQGQKVNANFFERPKKPYVIFNHLNLGKYVIDDTSLVEQAAALQDILDKRGRQIVENADMANSGSIFNSAMVSQDNVAQLIGDPDEKLMVNGDVKQAAMRLPMNILPPYVMQDKQDARQEIDNIFGTHDPIRGEDSGSKTLGQDVLSQRADLSRVSTVGTSLEDGFDRLYKAFVQMMKVFYDEPQMIKYTGPDGRASFSQFSQDSIEDGIAIRVKSGSVLPDDPGAKLQQTIQLMGVLDPLTIAEGMNEENPKEIAMRMMLVKLAPDQYINKILGEDIEDQQDDQAVAHSQQLDQGQPVPPEENPSQAHLAQHQAIIQSPQIASLPDGHPVKQAHIDHAKAEAQNARNALGQPTPPPTGPAQPPPQKGQPAKKPGILGRLQGAVQALVS